MKFPKISLAGLILLFAFCFCVAQETPKAYLIAEAGKPCSEEFSALYDSFLIELNNNPTAIGYVIFYGDEKVEGRNLNYIDALIRYPKWRIGDTSRIITVRGKNQNKMKMQFWIVPAGSNPPKPEQEFVEQTITSTTLFDKNWADFNNWSGVLDIYSNGFLELGCEFSPNVKNFADVLLSKPNLTGYLVVYTKFGKGKRYGNRIASFAVVDLMNNYKVPRNRLKTIYGGNREEPEIELWFVPKSDAPPTPKPDSTLTQ